MNPSGDIVKGSSITFSCSSDASPPVTQRGYSLYKDGHFVSSGQSHAISDVEPSHSGMYYCQAWNNISRRGNDLMKSAEVHLDVQCKYVDMSHCYRTQAHCSEAWVSRFSCCVQEGGQKDGHVTMGNSVCLIAEKMFILIRTHEYDRHIMSTSLKGQFTPF